MSGCSRNLRTTTDSKHKFPIARNILNREFTACAPNRVWVTDITFIWTAQGWLYLAGVKDVYTCEIVGYAMGSRMTKELCKSALQLAVVCKKPAEGLLHHSDRGS